MPLYIVPLSGKNRGKRYELTPGLEIGRKIGNLIIEDDPKVSARHARVELGQRGILILRDLDSANGIFLGEKRLKKISLVSGISFRVGNTELQVLDEKKLGIPPTEITPMPTQNIENSAKLISVNENLPPKPQTTTTKLGMLKEILRPLLKPDAIVLSQAFPRLVVLQFVSGCQLDQKIYLGYGPRRAGFCHYDLSLTDPKAPDLAFQISCEHSRILLDDLSHYEVKLNNSYFEQSFLKEGDVISFANSQIRVGFL